MFAYGNFTLYVCVHLKSRCLELPLIAQGVIVVAAITKNSRYNKVRGKRDGKSRKLIPGDARMYVSGSSIYTLVNTLKKRILKVFSVHVVRRLLTLPLS